MNQIQIERIAAAIHALRPDWPVQSLAKFISDRRNQPMTDLLVQLVMVAVDPETKTPARIDQDGPWKRALSIAPTDHNTSAHIPVASPTDCDICSRSRERCELDDSHEYVQRNRREHVSAEVIEQVKKQVRGAA